VGPNCSKGIYEGFPDFGLHMVTQQLPDRITRPPALRGGVEQRFLSGRLTLTDAEKLSNQVDTFP
jgi:hypothetical protein